MNETLKPMSATLSYLSPQYEVLILIEIFAQKCIRTRTNKSKHSVKDVCIMYYKY